MVIALAGVVCVRTGREKRSRLVVAGATSAGAAPQTLENSTVESNRKRIDIEQSGLDHDLISSYHNDRQLCEVWCRPLMKWTEVELGVEVETWGLPHSRARC